MLYPNKFIVISAVIGFLLMCLVYNLWQDKRAAEQKINELSAKLLQLENNAIKQNQIIAENENAKRELENTSLEQQEKINELLKDNDCAIQSVPVSISNSLYNRAKNLRQSTDTSKSAKWLHPQFTS